MSNRAVTIFLIIVTFITLVVVHLAIQHALIVQGLPTQLRIVRLVLLGFWMMQGYVRVVMEVVMIVLALLVISVLVVSWDIFT